MFYELNYTIFVEVIHCYMFFFVIAAPEYWGNLHSAWKLCGIGKRQSPVDLEAEKLLFDPELDRLELDSGAVSCFFCIAYILG